jgi:hypothetical protein
MLIATSLESNCRDISLLLGHIAYRYAHVTDCVSYYFILAIVCQYHALVRIILVVMFLKLFSGLAI